MKPCYVALTHRMVTEFPDELTLSGKKNFQTDNVDGETVKDGAAVFFVRPEMLFAQETAGFSVFL